MPPRALLASLLLLAAIACPQFAFAQDVPPASPAARRIDSILTAKAREGLSGSMMLVEHGKMTLAKGYGYADHARKLAFNSSTVVQIGSNTKDFTAVAILQLVQAGRLSLDDSLASIWAGVPAAKRGITIRQLLTHRAGLPQHGGDDFAPVERPQMVDGMLDTPLLFAPGSRMSYSNVGYSVLAAIVELKSGMTFDEYVSSSILSRIGLTDTGLLLPHFEERRLAHGYRRDGTDFGTMLSRPHAADGPFWNLRGNGGMLSTLSDMRRFYDALFANTLVDERWRRVVFPDEDIDLAGTDGVNFFFYERSPGRQTVVLFASNSEAAPGGQIMRLVRTALGAGSDEK